MNVLHRIHALHHNHCHQCHKGKDQSSKEDDKVQRCHHIQLLVRAGEVTLPLIAVSLCGWVGGREGRGGACVGVGMPSAGMQWVVK